MKYIGTARPEVFPVQLEINSDDLAALVALLGKSSTSTFVDAGAAEVVAKKSYPLFYGLKSVCEAAGVKWEHLYQLRGE